MDVDGQRWTEPDFQPVGKGVVRDMYSKLHKLLDVNGHQRVVIPERDLIGIDEVFAYCLDTLDKNPSTRIGIFVSSKATVQLYQSLFDRMLKARDESQTRVKLRRNGNYYIADGIQSKDVAIRFEAAGNYCKGARFDHIFVIGVYNECTTSQDLNRASKWIGAIQDRLLYSGKSVVINDWATDPADPITNLVSRGWYCYTDSVDRV